MKKYSLWVGFWLLLQMVSFQLLAQIQSPSEFIGYPISERYPYHFQAVNYIKYVNKTSPQVKIEKYGETFEGRPLYLMYVSSSKNIQNLEQIRQNNLQKAGLLEGNNSQKIPVIAWMAYDIHGNEASCTPAALETAYRLLSPNEITKSETLENTLIIIDICVNPDGYNRYTNWIRQVMGKTPNPCLDAREHVEPWARGRYNHYLFDMNRDWAWQSQIETKARVRKYNEWLPHIYGDFHEMGINAPYYFAPAVEPYHEEITNFQRQFQIKIGKNNARYFDKKGWLYFTRERFDLLYPSYGDTWPLFNGAIGMTYEQAGNHKSGIQVVIEIGDTLTLAERIEHHVTAGLATIQTISENQEELLKGFENFYTKNRSNPSGKYKSFVIKNTNHPDKIQELTQYLDRQKIQYGTIDTEQNLQGFNYRKNQKEDFELEKNDLIVSTYQPKSTLVKVLFNPKTILKDSVTYDATAWALPYAFGLEAYATSSKLEVEPQKYELPKAQNNFPKTPIYGVLKKWESFEDAKFLAQLLQKKINVRFSTKKITFNNEIFPKGTLVILRGDNQNTPEFEKIVHQTAQKYNRQLTFTTTGFADNYPDLGSPEIQLIKSSRVAVLSEKGISPTGFGNIWYFMEQQLDYPITVIGTDYFDEINLRKYDILILPEIHHFANHAHLNKIKEWVKGGGKLITLGSSCQIGSSFGLEILPKDEEDSDQKTKWKFPKYEAQEREELVNSVAGAIFKVEIDNSHPLAYGYDNEYFTLKTSSKSYQFLAHGWNVGVLRENAWIDGFVGYKLKSKLSNTSVFATEKVGKGTVIYFVDNPIFRASWQNGRLLLANALFFVGK